MAYSSVDQVLAAFPPALSAVGVGSFDVSTTQVSSYYIYTADGLIDGYIAARYSTPVAPVPALLTMLSCDLVIYNMFRDRNLKVPDFMQDRYDGAISTLKMIAEGDIKLPGATEVETGDNYAFSTGQGYHPVFSPVLDELEQTADADLVQAERDERFDDFNTSSL